MPIFNTDDYPANVVQALYKAVKDGGLSAALQGKAVAMFSDDSYSALRTPGGGVVPLSGGSGSSGYATLFNEGSDGSDVTTNWRAATLSSNSTGVPIALPPWPILVSGSFIMPNSMFGTKGKSKILLASDFTMGGFNNQFCAQNASFSQAYNDSTANILTWRDFDIECATPHTNRSFVGLANIKTGLLWNVGMRAGKYISGGVPVKIDTLLDFYASAHDVTVFKCQLRNLTGAHGATLLSDTGGSAAWVRNITSSGGGVDANGNLLNVTENISFIDCLLESSNSDEVVAFFGVRGTTRYCQLIQCVINGYLDSALGPFRPSTVSAFALDDDSGADLGDTATVHDIDIIDCIINDHGLLYDSVRTGDASQPTRKCYNIRTTNNKLFIKRSVTGGVSDAHTAWITLGAGANGTPTADSPDPDIACSGFRCIDGTINQAYIGAFSGNTSTDDKVFVYAGSQLNTAFNSYQKLNSPESHGNIYTGAGNCGLVTGGTLEAFGRIFYNSSARDTKYKLNGNSAGYVVFELNTTQGGIHSMIGTDGISSGGFVRVDDGTTGAGTLCNISNNMCVVGSGNALDNGSTTTTLIARNNTLAGTLSAVTTGVGTIVHTDNFWANLGATD